MKRAVYTLATVILSALPAAFALAQAGIADGASAGPFERLLKNILGFINTVLIPFIIGIGFLVFVWGMFKYFIAGGADEGKRDEGKNLMIYATLGFVLIIVFWGIVNLLTSSTGLQNESLQDVPKVTIPGSGSN
jgi:uncharacterized membrane protein YidH (DUF202 family)